MARSFVILCAAVLAASPVSSASAQSMVLAPLSGQVGTTFGQPWSLMAPSSSITVAVTVTYPSEKRGILEYPLPGELAGKTITSATLALDVTGQALMSSLLAFGGYSGDGIIAAADATTSTTSLETKTIGAPGPYTVSLDTPYIQSLLDGSATHLGIVVRLNGGETVFTSVSGSTPELTITYTPEPGSLLLLGTGAMVSLRRRRRRAIAARA